MNICYDPRCVLPAKNTSENQRQILLYLWSVGGAQDDKQINKIVMGMEQGQRGNRDFIKSGEKRSRRERKVWTGNLREVTMN